MVRSHIIWKYGLIDPRGFDDSKVLDDSKVISNGTNFDNPKFYVDAYIFAGHVLIFAANLIFRWQLRGC